MPCRCPEAHFQTVRAGRGLSKNLTRPEFLFMCQLWSNGSDCHTALNEMFIWTRLGGNECSDHLAVSSVSVGMRNVIFWGRFLPCLAISCRNQKQKEKFVRIVQRCPRLWVDSLYSWRYFSKNWRWDDSVQWNPESYPRKLLISLPTSPLFIYS